ncbi:MAG TPA: alpha/beta hydrolase [Verrucomicrobiota bacterium]|nr:alpha/beta hydrolase [Verrucomicrobiota bacterium]
MRRTPHRISLFCAGLALALSASGLGGGQAEAARTVRPRTYPPVLPEARAETYKTIGQTNLQLYVFTPKDSARTNQRPAIVFFFGGGWTSGSPQQFEKQCQYFASRGMVAIAADYRVASRQGAKAAQCVADAKSAIRWVRKNAARLGIDPNCVVAAGGSAGGHIAACAAVVPGLDEPGEDTSVSAVPNAAVLFNPVLVLAPLASTNLAAFASRASAARLGIEPRLISPAHHVRAGAPPMLVLHGKADTTVPFATAEAFAAKMKAAGNRCELVGFAGQGHGFFNFGRRNTRYFRETLEKADQFLTSLGYLTGSPRVNKFLSP